MDSSVQQFVAALAELSSPSRAFNPWRDVDLRYDCRADAPAIRRRHLADYLDSRLGRASLVLVGEAPGYQGPRFSGVPMCSERILLGWTVVDPKAVLPTVQPERTSRTELALLGMNEPTATITYDAFRLVGVSPLDVVIWSSFPFHPYVSDEDPLTNRTPTQDELRAYGHPCLRAFLELFPGVSVVAVGRKAEQALGVLGVPATHVRHPAHGGATAFRSGIQELTRSRR